MIRLENVRKSYKDKNADFELECSMELQEGRITGLIGANGAGKSTTFKAILNLITIDGGNIELFGKSHTKLTKEDKENIGVVLSDSSFSECLCPKDMMDIMKALYHKFDKKAFLGMCEELGIPLNKQFKEFSTGMKAKLKLAIAMSHEAKFLILDEPTSGLDVTARDTILEMLQDYMEKNEDAGILISSHISTDLEKICDDIYMIHDGKIVLHEETDELLENYAILRLEEKQFDSMEKDHFLRKKKESYGYSVLTDERQFFMENYPKLVIEKGTIDDIILMMTKGEAI